VQIERVRAHQEKTALDLDLRADWAQGIPVQNLDLIKVFPINPLMHEVVYLKGHVVRPGPYQFRPGMRVRELVPSLQALLPGAYLDYAQLLRLAPFSAGGSLNGSTRMVIPVNLHKVLEGDEAANLPLASLDELTVFATEDLKARPSVAVLGEVRSPGRFPLLEEMRVSDLLFLGGGLTAQTSTGEAELTRYRVQDSTTV
jgi:protein involved in polysaccharide export with SLBB domain